MHRAQRVLQPHPAVPVGGYGGDGIVTKGIEATLKNVGRLGKEGMKATNEEIIKIMINE